jgi:RNA-dependent RNA polymerase
LKTIGSGRSERVRLGADLTRREVKVFFQLTKFDPQSISVPTQGQVQEYRFRIPFARLSHILQVRGSGGLSFVIPLDTPPVYHRKLQDLTETFTDSESLWRSSDTWFRQTDIVHAQKELALSPISLRKVKPLIDIGK